MMTMEDDVRCCTCRLQGPWALISDASAAAQCAGKLCACIPACIAATWRRIAWRPDSCRLQQDICTAHAMAAAPFARKVIVLLSIPVARNMRWW